jgi:hypothetical protein
VGTSTKVLASILLETLPVQGSVITSGGGRSIPVDPLGTPTTETLPPASKTTKKPKSLFTPSSDGPQKFSPVGTTGTKLEDAFSKGVNEGKPFGKVDVPRIIEPNGRAVPILQGDDAIAAGRSLSKNGVAAGVEDVRGSCKNSSC